MAKLMALYNLPVDAAAFDAHYFGEHVPLASPALDTYEVNLANFAQAGVQMLMFDTRLVWGTA